MLSVDSVYLSVELVIFTIKYLVDANLVGKELVHATRQHFVFTILTLVRNYKRRDVLLERHCHCCHKLGSYTEHNHNQFYGIVPKPPKRKEKLDKYKNTLSVILAKFVCGMNFFS